MLVSSFSDDSGQVPDALTIRKSSATASQPSSSRRYSRRPFIEKGSPAPMPSWSRANSAAALWTRPPTHAKDPSKSPRPDLNGQPRSRSRPATPGRSRSLAFTATSQPPPFLAPSSNCVAPMRSALPRDSGNAIVASRVSRCCSLRALTRLISNAIACSSPGRMSCSATSSAITSMSSSPSLVSGRRTGRSFTAMPWIHHSPFGSWRTSTFVLRITIRFTTRARSAMRRESAMPILTWSAAMTRDSGAARFSSAS